MKIYQYKIRRFAVGEMESITVSNAQAVYEASKKLFDFDREQEQVVCAFLNTSNEIKGIQLVSIGGLDAAFIHPRDIFKPAILSSAASVIVLHNHPSGNLVASTQDRAVFEQLKEGGKTLGIKVMDFLIINENSFTSLL